MSEQIAKYTKLFRWLAEQCWDGCDVDGAELQAQLALADILVPTMVTKPCCKACRCADYGEFPTECFRLDPAFARKPAKEPQP